MSLSAQDASLHPSLVVPAGTAAPLALPWAGLVGVAICVTLAGLVWLGLSSSLAATGRQIARSDQRRQALLERRVEALNLYAEQSNPRRLAERALALGFVQVSANTFEILPVADPEALALEGAQGLSSPLDLALRAGTPGRVDIQEADLSSVLMSLGAAAPASAAEVAGGSQR